MRRFILAPTVDGWTLTIIAEHFSITELLADWPAPVADDLDDAGWAKARIVAREDYGIRLPHRSKWCRDGAGYTV